SGSRAFRIPGWRRSLGRGHDGRLVQLEEYSSKWYGGQWPEARLALDLEPQPGEHVVPRLEGAKLQGDLHRAGEEPVRDPVLHLGEDLLRLARIHLLDDEEATPRNPNALGEGGLHVTCVVKCEQRQHGLDTSSLERNPNPIVV